MSQNFWNGPHGIKISTTVSMVLDEYGNELWQNGGDTDMALVDPLSAEEYFEKYCKKQNDEWWWNEEIVC